MTFLCIFDTGSDSLFLNKEFTFSERFIEMNYVGSIEIMLQKTEVFGIDRRIRNWYFFYCQGIKLNRQENQTISFISNICGLYGNEDLY